MALTVRPDDEVYQFDTVWLGPDEYTLPIQARYVAWGTWLACFLVAAAILVPLGGDGPAGVLGSLVWSLALSVVLSRAVMLVVDHERPLRSLPALFSAEARAAMAARRRAERALLVRPGTVRVRPTPEKVRAIRERQRAARGGRRGRRRTGRAGPRRAAAGAGRAGARSRRAGAGPAPGRGRPSRRDEPPRIRAAAARTGARPARRARMTGPAPARAAHDGRRRAGARLERARRPAAARRMPVIPVLAAALPPAPQPAPRRRDAGARRQPRHQRRPGDARPAGRRRGPHPAPGQEGPLMARRREEPRPAPLALALREIAGNITLTRRSAYAWYVVPPARWAWRADGDRRGMVDAAGIAYAGLAGRRVRIRVTSRPYPVAAWARGLHARTPSPLPGAEDSTWSDNLLAQQRYLRTSATAEKEVYLGVEIAPRSRLTALTERLTGGAGNRELAHLDRDVELISEVVGGPGHRRGAGRPAPDGVAAAPLGRARAARARAG